MLRVAFGGAMLPRAVCGSMSGLGISGISGDTILFILLFRLPWPAGATGRGMGVSPMIRTGVPPRYLSPRYQYLYISISISISISGDTILFILLFRLPWLAGATGRGMGVSPMIRTGVPPVCVGQARAETALAPAFAEATAGKLMASPTGPCRGWPCHALNCPPVSWL